MNELTERQKLELAARAGGVRIFFNGDIAFDADSGRAFPQRWDPRRYERHAIQLMISTNNHSIAGSTVEQWMENVFRAAVYDGQTMEVGNA